MLSDEHKDLLTSPEIVRFLGAFAGVLLSMVMIPPDNTRSAFYRIGLGTIAGFIFAPTTQRLVPFLSGEHANDWLAAACATGFMVWFVLEALARWISTPDTGRKLIAWVERRMGVTVKGNDNDVE